MSGRVVLVTGAARGIGRAIVERLEADGETVVAVDLEPGPGGVAADLTTREGNRTAVDSALERHGRLDAIVPNAGFQHVAPVAEFPEERWDALLALLLTSPFLLAKYAWEALKASGDGRIVIIASAHGLTASPFKAGYVSAKHGVIGLMKTLALEGAADGSWPRRSARPTCGRRSWRRRSPIRPGRTACRRSACSRTSSSSARRSSG